VTVGKVAGLFGVRGWVRIYSYTRPIENILDFSPWYLRDATGWSERHLMDGRRHGRGLVAVFEGIDDRNGAHALVGQEIAVRRSQLPPSGPGEFYWQDLVGLEVVNAVGEHLGRVDHLMETGANDVLVVHGDRERLIPLVPAHVRRIDPDAGRIEVDWHVDD
jgi:16S rRNA processing protein RimM